MAVSGIQSIRTQDVLVNESSRPLQIGFTELQTMTRAHVVPRRLESPAHRASWLPLYFLCSSSSPSLRSSLTQVAGFVACRGLRASVTSFRMCYRYIFQYALCGCQKPLWEELLLCRRFGGVCGEQGATTRLVRIDETCRECRETREKHPQGSTAEQARRRETYSSL